MKIIISKKTVLLLILLLGLAVSNYYYTSLLEKGQLWQSYLFLAFDILLIVYIIRTMHLLSKRLKTDSKSLAKLDNNAALESMEKNKQNILFINPTSNRNLLFFTFLTGIIWITINLLIILKMEPTSVINYILILSFLNAATLTAFVVQLIGIGIYRTKGIVNLYISKDKIIYHSQPDGILEYKIQDIASINIIKYHSLFLLPMRIIMKDKREIRTDLDNLEDFLDRIKKVNPKVIIDADFYKLI